MTPELIAALCDHAQGNLRALMNLSGEMLAVATQREARLTRSTRSCRYVPRVVVTLNLDQRNLIG
jgi:hypothetical protein